MRVRVVFRPEAAAELIEVRRWYDSRRPGLGSRFGTAVGDVIEIVQAARVPRGSR